MTLEGDRLVADEDVASILVDDDRPEYLGGQFVHAAVASLDWGRMADFFRTGEPIRERPDRYRVAIERLTAQDIAVFFQEALAALPQLVADLGRGGRVVDVHCGGGRWLIAMARRFPASRWSASSSRPIWSRERGRRSRPRGSPSASRSARRAPPTTADAGDFDLAYFQYALHQLADAPAVLRAAWSALRPGGRIVVLDWPLPSSQEEWQSRHGALIAGVQLDELYQGTALVTPRPVPALVRGGRRPESGGRRPAVGRIDVRRRPELIRVAPGNAATDIPARPSGPLDPVAVVALVGERAVVDGISLRQQVLDESRCRVRIDHPAPSVGVVQDRR